MRSTRNGAFGGATYCPSCRTAGRWSFTKKPRYSSRSCAERPPEERDAFLRLASAGDEALELEVRSLLTSQQQAESFLESPAMEVAARALAAFMRGVSHGGRYSAASCERVVISLRYTR